MAMAGYSSRRKAEETILTGRVRVNGVVVKELGTKVDAEKDVVFVDEKQLDVIFQQHIYVLFHKPRGVVSTCSDPEGRPTVMDYMRGVPTRVFPVGRLDYLSEGLLLMTNDGDLAQKIMHPRYEVTKVYEVKVFGQVTTDILQKLRKGIKIGRKQVVPLSVRIIKQLPQKTWLEFRLKEGKNREIRRFCEAQGMSVDKLKRVAIEGLTIDDVAPGKYRMIPKKQLLSSLGLNRKGEFVDGQEPLSNYISPKKTIKVTKVMKVLAGTKRLERPLAVDEKFMKFRKKYYQETMRKMKEFVQEDEQILAQKNLIRPKSQLVNQSSYPE